MTDVYFNDFFDILRSHLYTATKSIKIAVAWINFEMYYPLFNTILQNGVKLEIIVDENHINRKHQFQIAILENMKVLKFIKMPGYSIMHEKFCIIDNRTVLTGSYNWTPNATNNNYENLLICDDQLLVQKFLFEFKQLKEITLEKIYYLHASQKKSIFNICSIEEENNTTAKLSIFTVEEGVVTTTLLEDYYDLGLYTNISCLYDDINDRFQYDTYEISESEKLSIYNFELQKYIINYIEPLTHHIIHALAVEAYDIQYRNYDDHYLKVIWKNRFLDNFIENRYEL